MDIPLFKIHWDEKDVEAVKEVISSGKYWSSGEKIEKFENAIAEYLDTEYCLVFNSGGTALHSLMKAYGFEQGDEIIVPSFTFIATPYAPMYVDARPVFADVEKETFGLNPSDVKKKITSDTKAIMPIHYGGMPCKIDELQKIAEENDLILIEDAAESFGAEFNGKSVGTFGRSGVYSFCHNKVFTTGEGGCVVTEDKDLYEKLKLIRSYGRVVEGNYFTNPENLDYKELGYNYRMSTMSAALGLSQIKKVDKTTKLRRKHAQYLNKKLRDIEDIVVPTPPNDMYHAVYQMYTIRVLAGKDTRTNLMEYLQDERITTRIYFEPVHNYTLIQDHLNQEINVPITEELSDEVVTLPLYPDITKKELKYIVNKVKEFFER